MRTAFITGIAGQDGSYLAEQLVAEGTAVHGLVHPNDNVLAELAALGGAVTLHRGDVAHAEDMEALINHVKPDEVYNLAAISSVAASWERPIDVTRVNAMAVAQLLDTLRRADDHSGRRTRFVQASSAEIFAGSGEVPQTEQTPIWPLSPYGASKAYAHNLVQVYRNAGMLATNAILYNHESPRRPPSFVTRKITSTVAAIAQGRAERLTLGNLDAQRDWGWAPDYVAGLVLAARHDHAGDYVFATGQAHSVADFVSAAFAHVGIDDWHGLVEVDPSFSRPTDSAVLVGLPMRAERELGWRAEVGFSALVARMVDADLAAAG